MHNQDTSKDDFLESIFEIANKIIDYFKERSKELKDYQLETNDDKLNEFQVDMKKVINETENEKTKQVAQTLHDNPEESMKIIQEVVKKRFENDIKESTAFLDGIKKSIGDLEKRSLGLDSNSNITINIKQLNMLSEKANETLNNLINNTSKNLNNSTENIINTTSNERKNYTSKNQNEIEYDSVAARAFSDTFYKIKEETSNKGSILISPIKGSEMIELVSLVPGKEAERIHGTKLNILDYAPLITERKLNNESIRDLFNNNINYTSTRLNDVKTQLENSGLSKSDAKDFVLKQYKENGILDSVKNSKLEKNVSDLISNLKKENDRSSVDKNEKERSTDEDKAKKQPQQEMTMER